MKRIQKLMSQMSDMLSGMGDAIKQDVDEAFKDVDKAFESFDAGKTKPAEANPAEADRLCFDTSQIMDVLVQHVQQKYPGRKIEAIQLRQETFGQLKVLVTFVTS